MKKKSIKMHLAKVFIALGGTTTIAASCNVTPSVGYENFAEDLDEGLQLLPIEVYMPEEVDIQGIVEFARDAMINPNFKEKFHRNPEGLLKQYGIEYFDKNSAQIQLLLAGSDPEIIEAIRQNDFHLYLSLLEKKNYLQSDVVVRINNMFKDGVVPTRAYNDEALNFVLAIPIVLAAAAVVVVAAAWAVAAWAHIATSTDIFTTGYADSTLLTDDAINLYLDETKSLNTIEMDEEEYVSAVREVILNANVSDDPATNNTLFQLGCGTVGNILNE